MDLTSTSSLVLFPTVSTQISRHENIEQYHELARLATWHLPLAQQQQYSQQQCQHRQQHLQYHQPQLPSARVAAMSTQSDALARRRQEREELKRVQITSFRSKDGLLSPPPLPTLARRRKKSIGTLNPRAMESSPELSSPGSSDSESVSSVPGTPPPYGTRSYAASAVDLRINTSQGVDGVGLGISGPKSAHVMRGNNLSPKRLSPFRNNTMDDALLGIGLIQPPSPSLLRPKSFWKNHHRSALTSLAYSPCSQVVRRSTFVAAGMNIDQGYWDGNHDGDLQSSDRPPKPPSKDRAGDKENVDPNYESDSEDNRQNEAIRAFGQSLWNASTLALAVESRTRGVHMAGPVVCVPGEF